MSKGFNPWTLTGRRENGQNLENAPTLGGATSMLRLRALLRRDTAQKRVLTLARVDQIVLDGSASSVMVQVASTCWRYHFQVTVVGHSFDGKQRKQIDGSRLSHTYDAFET